MILKFFFSRELLRHPFFFLLLGVTIFLGTLGLTGIGVVSQEVNEKLRSRAHELLTSDFAVSARRDLFPQEKEALRETLKDIPHESYKVVDIYSMVTHLESAQARLVEIRGIEDGYPFHGSVSLAQGALRAQELYITKDLETLWRVSAGDKLRVGELELKVEGVVVDDSSVGLRGFSLAPRIYLPLSVLERTGLLLPGSTGSHAYHFRLPGFSESELKELKSEIYRKISDPAVKVALPEDSSMQTGRVINNVTNFMSLAALVGLILSLVGIFYLYQSHLLARLKDLCLLNLYGLTKTTIVFGIVGQFSAVFLLIFVLEVLAVWPLYKFILPALARNLGLDLEGNLSLGAVLGQLPFLYGLTLSMLTPLLLGLLRTPMGAALKSGKITMGRFRFYDFIPFLVLLWSFSWYLSNSLRVGNYFFLGLVLVFTISALVVQALQWLLRRFLTGAPLALPKLTVGVALRNLSRSGHKLTLSFLSLAMGAALISLILQLERMIQTELALGENRPGLFIFDIQDDQMEDLVSFAEKRGTPLEALTPMIRARLEKVNGEKFKRPKANLNLRSDREDDVENRARNTGLNITYRGKLSPAEKIIAGRPFTSAPPSEDRLPQVSLEKRWAQRMGVEIGDRLTFDVQGVELDGEVVNLRDVKWTSFYPNFFVTLEPGYLEGAPKTYLAVLGAGHKEKKTEFQRAVVTEFPNVSFIDVEELVEKIGGLFEKSRVAIELISLLSLGVGLAILYGLSQDQVYRRYYDLALMKSLGFSSELLQLLLLLEFGALFLAAAGVGLFLGWLMAQVIGQEIFKLSFSIDWSGIILPAIAITILCLATILISSWRAVRARPRELLSDS